MMEWFGIFYEENIYYGKNHCPVQILRNCVHPAVGEHIFYHLIVCNECAHAGATHSAAVQGRWVMRSFTPTKLYKCTLFLFQLK